MSENKYFTDQMEGEDVQFVFRKHPVVMRKGIIIAMLCLLLGTVPSLIKPEYQLYFEGLGVGLIIGLILFLPSWISWYYSVFIVTNQRFIQITQKGLFHRSVVDLNLHQIQMVNYEVFGFQETILGFGTIIIQTYMGDLVIHNVHHPAKTQRKILSILRDLNIVAVPAPIEDEQEVDEADA